jgi:GNAT superfamily N-acetyltransferase
VNPLNPPTPRPATPRPAVLRPAVLRPAVLRPAVLRPAVLRPATAADATAVAAIWAAGWRDGHLGHVPEELVAARTPSSFAERAAQRVADTTVAEAGEEVAGFVMVVADEVEQVYVSAAHRGSGIAGVLLAEAERQVAANGHARAWLAVVPGNARARRFYERQGWTDDSGFDYQAGGVTVPCRRYVKPVTSSTPDPA